MAYFVFGAIEMEVVTKLLLAIFLSGIIGLERELKERPAGLRTHILVCMGATFLTLVSLLAFGGDSDSVARVISGTITGIGFLPVQ